MDGISINSNPINRGYVIIFATLLKGIKVPFMSAGDMVPIFKSTKYHLKYLR